MTIEQIEYHVRRLLCKKDYTIYDPNVDGQTDTLYVDESTADIYIWDGTTYITADNKVRFVATLPVTGTENILYVLPDGTIHIWDGAAFVTGGVTLTDGNGTTANGSAVDLGGTLTNNTTVQLAGNNFNLEGDVGIKVIPSTKIIEIGDVYSVFGETKIIVNDNTEDITLDSASTTVTGQILSSSNIAFGTSTGVGRIRLPHAGTTSADGISFGSTLNLFRLNANTLSTGGYLQLVGLYGGNFLNPILLSNHSGIQILSNPATGSSSPSALSINQTWNTTGTPALIFANVTNTASGASSRLLDLQVGGITRANINTSGTLTLTGNVSAQRILSNADISAATNSTINWNNRSTIASSVNGDITIGNSTQTDFSKLQLGGTTNLFPSLKRNTVNLEARLADDSAQTGILANNLNLGVTTGTGRINLPDGGTTFADGISFGTGTSNLYRSLANTLATDGNFRVAGIFNSRYVVNPTATATWMEFVPSTHAVLFQTNGVQRLIINTTGDIGIGNPSPSARLDIIGPTLTGSAATSALSITQTWNTTGSPTAFLMNITNTASGGSANLMDLQVNGVSRFRVDKGGVAQFSGYSTFSQRYGFNNGISGNFGYIKSSANGIFQLVDAGETDFNRLTYGGTTNLFPAIKRVGANLEARLADDSAQTGILANNLNLGVTTGTGRINLPDSGTTAIDGISFGSGSSNLYRSGANILKTDGAFFANGQLSAGSYSNVNTGFISLIQRTELTASTLTGSQETSALSITQTWNTTGNPTAIFLNITNTASGASAKLMDLQVGGASYFNIDKIGYTFSTRGFSTSNGEIIGQSSFGLRLITPTNAGVTINNDYSTVSARAMLEVKSTTKGFLPPRMTTAQRDVIATVAGDAGLTIFNTTTTKLEVWDGTTWQAAW